MVPPKTYNKVFNLRLERVVHDLGLTSRCGKTMEEGMCMNQTHKFAPTVKFGKGVGVCLT